ncbi:MAG: YjbQ family protein, partial [Moorea sp. SIO3E2]|nr:YjbQ family protein [Moorena sp. SIO3E2]
NDLHLRIVPPDEPINAHSHLMAMMLNNSEYIPIIDGKLALGTWESVLLVELDGPRDRTVLIQLCGET